MSARNAVTEIVVRMVEAVNRGDFDTARAAFGDYPVIVEDLAPFRWQGPEAVSHWLAAMGANAARLGVRAVNMGLGEPLRIESEGGSAYALFPGRLTLTAAEGALVADGTLTLTLSGAGDIWRIDTMVWSGSEPAPV